MTSATFAAYIRKRTKTNATTFTDADILISANAIKDDIAKAIIEANEDYFQIELLRDLVAGQRVYNFPSDLLSQMKYLEAQLDGIKWTPLDEIDLNTEWRGKATDEASIIQWMQGKRARFDITGSAVKLFTDATIIDVTDGLKLNAIIYPADLTSLTGTMDMSVAPTNTSFGMPRQLHYAWATKVIVEYKGSKEKPLPLTEREANVEQDQALAINSLKGQDLNRNVIGTVPTYNNGQDY